MLSALILAASLALDICTCAGWTVHLKVTAEGHPSEVQWYVYSPTETPQPKSATPPEPEIIMATDAVDLYLDEPGIWHVTAVVVYDHKVAPGETFPPILLDGTVTALGLGCVFVNGFETGNLSRWSGSQP